MAPEDSPKQALIDVGGARKAAAVTTNLVVCESPWTEQGLIQPWSMRPFVEGLTELSGARLIYRTFTTGEELKELLSYQAIDRPTKRTIVYIACHGYGGRLVPGRDGGSANLAPIALSVRRGVEGIWVGACDVGASQALRKFLEKSGAVWAGGYRCSVDWHPSMLIDLAVLQELLWGGAIRSRKAFVNAIGRALRAFQPKWQIGEDARGDRVELCRALRLFARDKVRGGRVAQVTHLVERQLRWTPAGTDPFQIRRA